MQAKGSFACTVIMLTIFVTHLGLAIFSCFPTEETRAKKRERLERRMSISALKDIQSPTFPLSPTGGSFGQNGLPPMTPRTLAFNRLGGTTDLPLRNHFSTPRPQSPPLLKESGAKATESNGDDQPTMYFPPPPKKATK
jgi:hypothetical protein